MGLATEEMIRWVTPVKEFMRTAQEDTMIRGVQIKAGESVLLSYPSGNRERISRSLATSSAGTSSRDENVGRANEMCIASWRAISGDPPATLSSTPTLFAGGCTYDEIVSSPVASMRSSKTPINCSAFAMTPT